MAGPIIHAFDADGTPSGGALIALEKWCRECVAEHVQEIIDNGHYVQWYGNNPPENGSLLQYNASENMWDNVPADDVTGAATIQDLARRVAELEANGSTGSPSGSSTATTTTPVGDLIVNGPDSWGNYAVSGTSVTGPNSFGNYGITSTGVAGPNSSSNYSLTSN